MNKIGLAVMFAAVAAFIACAPTSKLNAPGVSESTVLESPENARTYNTGYETTFRAALDALRQTDDASAKLVKHGEGLIIFKKPDDAGAVTVKVTKTSEETTRVEISAKHGRKYRRDGRDKEMRAKFFSALERMLGIGHSTGDSAEADASIRSGEGLAREDTGTDKARVLSDLKKKLRLEGEESFLAKLSYADLVLLENRMESLSSISAANDKLTQRCSACYIDLARVYHDDGRYKRAVEALGIALSIDPENAIAHCNLGEIYKHLGLYEKAVRELEEASRLDPELPDTYINLGIIYDDFLPDNKKALENYRKYVELGGADEQALVWIREIEEANP
jgi:tetratricopeptide (TPR) repeat protein